MRIYIGVAGVILFLVGLGIYILQAFQGASVELAGGIERLDSAIAGSDWDVADSTIEVIQRDWGKHKQWWPVFIDHQEIDNIDTALARTKKYIEAREKVLARGELAVLKLMLKHIPEKERVNLQNIF